MDNEVKEYTFTIGDIDGKAMSSILGKSDTPKTDKYLQLLGYSKNELNNTWLNIHNTGFEVDYQHKVIKLINIKYLSQVKLRALAILMYELGWDKNEKENNGMNII